MFLKKAAEFPVKPSLEVPGLAARTGHRWVLSHRKGKRPEGVLPKGHGILPEEREAILPSRENTPPSGPSDCLS